LISKRVLALYQHWSSTTEKVAEARINIARFCIFVEIHSASIAFSAGMIGSAIHASFQATPKLD
jgi:hypothetical protein